MNSIAACLSSFTRLKLLLLLVALPVLASAGEQPVWLILNPFSPETLMSTDVAEKNSLVRAGWKVTGAGLLHTESEADTGLVHRMVRPDPKGSMRMLVATPAEVSAELKAGYTTEGALGYVSLKGGPGLLTVYRYSKGPRYLWLVNWADQKWAEKAGWTREKAVFWLWAPADK